MPATKKAASSAKEKDQNIKTIAALAYIIFFLPLLTNRDSKFAMYHANQGLLVLLTSVVLNVAFSVLSIALIFSGLFFLFWVPGAVTVVLAILGILNAPNGEMKPLPVIGNITLIK